MIQTLLSGQDDTEVRLFDSEEKAKTYITKMSTKHLELNPNKQNTSTDIVNNEKSAKIPILPTSGINNAQYSPTTGKGIESFKQALKSYTKKFLIYMFKLKDADYTVYAFTLLVKDKDYWSHKPKAWEECIITEQQKILAFSMKMKICQLTVF